jgi:6-pyruvoyltetrahydropterin/6-carboxytetrahydropterin synthase
MRVGRLLEFEAAHYLTGVPPDHKCAGMHGHSYRVDLVCEGPLRDDGMVVEFGDIDAACVLLRRKLDHAVLNASLDNPTSERLARWIFLVLQPELPTLAEVTVRESRRSFATYRPDTRPVRS